MNKLYPFVLILGILFLTGTSCSKKSDPKAVIPVIPAIPPCVVTKTTLTLTLPGAADAVWTTTFEYDANLQLLKSTEVFHEVDPQMYTYTIITNYSYTDGLLTATNNGNGLSAKWTNASGHVMKISSTYGTPSITYTINFTYDSQGGLLTDTYTNSWEPNSQLNHALSYNSSGNLETSSSETVNEGASKGIFTTTYVTFDGKNNPFGLLAKAINQPFFYSFRYYSASYGEPDYFFSKNNPIAANLPALNQKIDYAYEYNDANYPTKMVITNNQSNLGTTTILFEYQACK